MKADTQTIDILLLGSGGREHALAAKLAASPRAGKLYIAPGNGGTASCGENVVLDDCDPAAVAAFAQSHGCGLVVIGPEAPLVAGVADAVRAAGIPCFGPGAEGAQMEGSKLFSKQLMERANIPTAAYGSFTDEASALAYVREQGAPLVVKAYGLAAGQGVIVATELEQAEEAVRECFGGTFGDAGNTVVIEEMLTGPECSLLAFTDGKTVRPMATSQDHKRALEGDLGPNTGGMGVYSPVPIVTDEEHVTMVKVMEQTVAELAAEGIDYRGCLYGGFMLTPAGPKVLEHMVDCVLYFEGDSRMTYRILRAAKNRFGATNEIGVFEMLDSGLREVENPSEMLLSGRPQDASGTCVTCVMEGARPVLAEIQALIAPCAGARPLRSSNGFDYNRAAMLMAVLEKRGALKVSGCDAFLNVIGGLSVDEPAADLAAVLALASSYLDKPSGNHVAAIGEVGLTGELRSVNHLSERLSEVHRLGFETCIIPKQRKDQIRAPQGLALIEARNIAEALRAIVQA